MRLKNPCRKCVPNKKLAHRYCMACGEPLISALTRRSFSVYSKTANGHFCKDCGRISRKCNCSVKKP